MPTELSILMLAENYGQMHYTQLNVPAYKLQQNALLMHSLDITCEFNGSECNTSVLEPLSASVTVKVGSSLRISSHSVCAKQLQQPVSTHMHKQLPPTGRKWKWKQNCCIPSSPPAPHVSSSLTQFESVH